jgi:hypothetical protein
LRPRQQAFTKKNLILNDNTLIKYFITITLGRRIVDTLTDLHLNLFKKIAPDKWKHFFVGILMGGVLEVAAVVVVPAHPVIASLIALTIVVFISYGFELYSLVTGRGHYDVMDAVASIIGGILGMAAGWMCLAI